MRTILRYSFLQYFGLFTLCCFGLFPSSSYEQEGLNQAKIDSLILVMISLDLSPKKADILNEISMLALKENYQVALTYAKHSLILAEDLEYDMGILRASANLGRIYTFYYLDYFEAKHYLARSLDIGEESRNDRLKMMVYSDYAYLMYAMGNCKDAIIFNEKAIGLAEKLQDYNRMASLNAYLADVYLDCEDMKRASEHFALAYSLFTSNKLSKIAPSVRMAAARHLRLIGSYNDAINTYVGAIQIFGREKRVRYESYAYSQLAQAQLEKGDYFGALNTTSIGLEIAILNDLVKERLDNYEVQVAAYDSLRDYKKTYVTLVKYTRLKDSLNTFQFQEQNRKFQTNFEEIANQNKLGQLKEERLNHQLQIENQLLNRNIIVSFLGFIGILVVLMILRLRYIRRKEREMKMLNLAASHSTNSIILFDSNMCVEWVNQGFERLTGLTLKEVKGQYFLDFYNGPELNRDHVEQLKENFISEKAFSMELASFHRKTREIYWISISVTPLYENQQLGSFVYVATDITAIHDAQEALQKSHDQAILLSEIGRQITSTLSVSQIIEKVYENVNKLMDAQNLGIGIFRELENDLFFPGPIEQGDKLNSFSYKVETKDRLAVRCYLDNQEICVGSTSEIFENNPSPLAGEQAESIIFMPLIAKWKTMGVISVQSFAQHAYSKKEVDMVRSLATYVAIALENAGLYENLERRVIERTKEVTAQKEQLELNYKNIKLLSEIGIQISSSLDFEDVFDTLYETVTKMMDAEVFGVRIYHEHLNEIEYKYEIKSGERGPVISVSMDDKNNYSVWCIENRKEILLGDNFLNEQEKDIKEIRRPIGKVPNSLIFYPMLAEGRIFGVITVQSFNSNAYSPYHVALVKTLSSYFAAALSNSRLYETLEGKVQERTKELGQKNKDIMASISYARRIQRGILPIESFMNQVLPKCLVFYRPRDIVSGDFYWVERNRGKVFFAVVDCTGHDVPGALMSIIGKNILDQAINEKEIDDPSMILTFLRAGLRAAFSTDESRDGEDIEDGMDLGLCVWNPDERTITFSGANSDMYLIHDGALEVIKGEKASVRANDFDMKNYTSCEIEILKGDYIYLSSDGFADQFGGDLMKKYSRRRFHELILNISELPIHEQEKAFDKEFLGWKGELDQLDDICIMGIKF